MSHTPNCMDAALHRLLSVHKRITSVTAFSTLPLHCTNSSALSERGGNMIHPVSARKDRDLTIMHQVGVCQGAPSLQPYIQVHLACGYKYCI